MPLDSPIGQLSYLIMLLRVRLLIFWFVFGSVAGSLPARAGMPEPEYLTVRNGLPQGFVNSIIQDRRGFIWMATRDGLCRYDGIRFRIYTHDPQDAQSLSFSSVYEIQEDQTTGKFWIRTENNNIDLFDPVTGRAKRVSNSKAFTTARNRNQLTGIQPDRAGNVWVATQTNGFFRLNANGTVSHRQWVSQPDSAKMVLHQVLFDRQQRLWLATQTGLFLYQPQTRTVRRFGQEQGIPRPDVYRLHERQNGELLLGFPGRVALFDPKSERVRQLIDLPNQPGLPLFATDRRGNDYINQNRYSDKNGLSPLLTDPAQQSAKLTRFAALSLLVDRTNVLWIGLNGDGIIKYDLNKRPFQTWPYVSNFQTDWLTQQLGIPSEAIPAGIRQQPASAIQYQFNRRKTLWISSPQTVPYRYDAAVQRFIPVEPAGIKPRWLPDGTFRLTALAAGAEGELWGLLGPNNQAVVRHNPALATFTAFPLPLPPDHPYTITAMVVDGGRIYLATENHGLLRADLSQKRLIRWRSAPNDPNSLPGNALLCLAQDPKQYNFLWIGTFGEGLCRLDKMTGQIKRFTVGQGLSNNIIYAIRTDRDGHLWLSTNRGLCRFDTRTFDVQNYMTDDGLPSEEFKQNHDVTLPDGRLIFGGIGGYTAFDPRQIRQDPFKPTVALTALRINNELVTTNSPNSPIEQNINEIRMLVLTHQQNFLSVDFAALEFNQSHKNQYRYKLIGLDKGWVYSGNTATATYTNLPPNTYTFVVNASNTSGIWSPAVHTLQITINPPLWATWWAYTAYALAVLGLLVLFVWIRIRRIQQRSQMQLREQEAMQLKHLNEVKTRFFANITHELRTPLTLILTPLEQTLAEAVNSPFHPRLTLIHRNASRLLRLINELLDLAKLDAGNLTITPAPADLPAFIQRITQGFEDKAVRKQVALQVTSAFSQPVYFFDSDKVEKILSNLLSNALKFTDPNGSIQLLAGVVPTDSAIGQPAPIDWVQLSVTNTGLPIPAEKLPHLFNRFYQVDPQAEGSLNGSGIGLAIVKELVELMQGRISVESQLLTGTTFVIELPLERVTTHQQLAGATAEQLPVTALETSGVLHSNSPDELVGRILLVEDNDELAEYIASTLTSEWRVKRVNNGRAGVAAAIAEGPDLIISDVLMPEMNGYELCQALKGNPITSHIPIILLTAKASVESRVEGLNAGADDYVAKPFQVAELRGRVRNRLEHQIRTRQHLKIQLLGEGNLPVASPNPQDEFMNRLYKTLEGRLDDSTFGVEPMAAVLGISRMHLNRKVKAVTGLSPNELIRIVRLKRAAELLLTGVSVSEVADRVGFDTPAYFSKVFKEQYHLTPSEYVGQHRQEVA